MKFDLEKLVRQNIRTLKPYSSARLEFKGEAAVLLDANENSFGSPLNQNFNRYPDPLQSALKLAIQKIKGVPVKNIFIGNGSDEVIDLTYRIFCDPGNNVIICPPTYGMYEVSANINNVEIKKVNLTSEFQLDVNGILGAINDNTKLIFICSPNNPTGNNMNRNDIELLLNRFPGIIVIDEAYINFSGQKTFVKKLSEFPNLIVMQTFSKAWGLAALRLGLCFASAEIISLFNKVKPPYNINLASQQLALEALGKKHLVNNWINRIIEQRAFLINALSDFSFVKKIYDSDANFLLVKVQGSDALYQYLLSNKIVIRNRSKEVLCENCIRITVGTSCENEFLLEALKNFKA
ncbi:MAG TPA: histidinol-phosphate transaminase [Chitinophagaceae bacterium]|nr:histidinol-phosphate transaminase [Chitinophagaceae bacterium]